MSKRAACLCTVLRLEADTYGMPCPLSGVVEVHVMQAIFQRHKPVGDPAGMPFAQFRPALDTAMALAGMGTQELLWQLAGAEEGTAMRRPSTSSVAGAQAAGRTGRGSQSPPSGGGSLPASVPQLALGSDQSEGYDPGAGAGAGAVPVLPNISEQYSKGKGGGVTQVLQHTFHFLLI